MCGGRKRQKVVWTFHKLTCDSTVNFAVFVDGSAQDVQYKDTPFSDRAAVEFSFEAAVSSKGAIDFMFGNDGSWSCDNSALSIRLRREDRPEMRAGPCNDGLMERFETVCNSGGQDVLASTHHFWIEAISEIDCYHW